jgi:hypothetical protein
MRVAVVRDKGTRKVRIQGELRQRGTGTKYFGQVESYYRAIIPTAAELEERRTKANRGGGTRSRGRMIDVTIASHLTLACLRLSSDSLRSLVPYVEVVLE